MYLLLLLMIPISISLVVLGGILYLRSMTTDPFSPIIASNAHFPLYYPVSIPEGFVYDNASARLENDIVFFTLRRGDETINISEQATPVRPPDFDAIQRSNTSFKTLGVLGGQAIYGVYQKTPAAIILTNTTLININGAKNMPLDVVANVAQSMRSL